MFGLFKTRWHGLLTSAITAFTFVPKNRRKAPGKRIALLSGPGPSAPHWQLSKTHPGSPTVASQQSRIKSYPQAPETKAPWLRLHAMVTRREAVKSGYVPILLAGQHHQPNLTPLHSPSLPLYPAGARGQYFIIGPLLTIIYPPNTTLLASTPPQQHKIISPLSSSPFTTPIPHVKTPPNQRTHITLTHSTLGC